MSTQNFLTNLFNKLFKYTPNTKYNFIISTSNEPNIETTPISPSPNSVQEKFNTNLDKNINIFKVKYNSLLSSDVIIREFILNANNTEFKAALIYIDGMVDSKMINESILRPLMLKNKSNTKSGRNNSQNRKEVVSEFNNNDVIIRKIKKFNLSKYILNKLLPENDVTEKKTFYEAVSSINMGNCILLIDTINTCLDIDVKGFKQRSVGSPQNEIVIRGAQEAFVENIRTNTSMLRRIINNENLVIENCKVGKITKTTVAVCYLSDLANNDLVAEIKYRINNLQLDHLISSGQLEQLIQDNTSTLFPQLIATERPDKACIHLLEGRVVILVNNSPYALIAPGVLSDFLSSPEDKNYKFQFSNILKVIRLIAIFLALFLPGLYVAVTSYHHELLPTELLFTIDSARKTVPFPFIFEILLMEISFELIREAGLRVPSPIGPTIGIVGGLILGDAAVSANLVSPVLIIIVAITAICSFSIPDFSLNFTIRICRFFYIFLGYAAGFLGIAVGAFIQLLLLCNLKSFGCPYLTPYLVQTNANTSNAFFLPPIWKREKRSSLVQPKRKNAQNEISMLWKYHNTK